MKNNLIEGLIKCCFLRRKINLGLQVDFFGLLSVLQDNLNAKVKMATAEANYRVSRAAIQRLMRPE